MADPLSIAGLVLQIGALLKQLYDYGREVKGARKDISALSSELHALKGVLEDCKIQYGQTTAPGNLDEVLKAAQETLNDLLQSLAPGQSRARRLQQSLWWPLKSDEVEKILTRLERVKSLLLLDLMGGVHDALQGFDEIKRDVKIIAETVAKESARRKDIEISESRRKLLERIAPVSPAAAHSQVCSVSRVPASGSWFLEGPFKTWMTENPPKTQIMSLIGKSGAGKTTLVASTIERLRQEEPATPSFAYMYCTYNDSATREARNIFGAWLAQLCHEKPAVLGPLEDQQRRGQEVGVSHLADALVDITESNGPILLILDALNESKDPGALCTELLNLVRRTTSIRVLLSSTSDLEISNQDKSNTHRKVDISTTTIVPDVKSYIQQKRLQNAVLSRVPEQAFLDAILPRTNGMFRWAVCQMDIVGQYSTPKKVKEALKHLPGSLDDTYVALLQRVPAVSRDLVRDALLWLSYSLRPLRLSELLDAVVIEEGDEVIDDDCRIFPPTKLVDMCEGLVTWNAATDIVSLAHNSVRTFLESDFTSSSPVAFFKLEKETAELSIIRKCLTHILMKPFAIGYCTKTKIYDLHESYPLLEYAATMWAVHAQPYAATNRLTQVETELINLLFQTYPSADSRGSNFAFWVYTLIPESSHFEIKQAHPLYYASSFGLTQIVTSLLTTTYSHDKTSPWYIDRKAGRAFSTALQVACWRGHEGVVAALLEAGADPNSTDMSGLTNLGCAQSRGHEHIAEILVKAGARPGVLHKMSVLNERRWEMHPFAGMPYRGMGNVKEGEEEDVEGAGEERTRDLEKQGPPKDKKWRRERFRPCREAE